MEISLTTQAFDQLNLSLNLSIEGDGYKQTTFPFSVITNADVLVEYITVEETVIRTKTIPTTIYSNPPLNIPILLVGILIGIGMALGGIFFYNRTRDDHIQIQWDKKKVLWNPRSQPFLPRLFIRKEGNQDSD